MYANNLYCLQQSRINISIHFTFIQDDKWTVNEFSVHVFFATEKNVSVNWFHQFDFIIIKNHYVWL